MCFRRQSRKGKIMTKELANERSRRRLSKPRQEAGYTSAGVIIDPHQPRPLQSGGVHMLPDMTAPA
jgi:hypothetical protein